MSDRAKPVLWKQLFEVEYLKVLKLRSDSFVTLVKHHVHLYPHEEPVEFSGPAWFSILLSSLISS